MEQMQFPQTFDEFAEQYKIVDRQQVYTNGTKLIPVFRVKQWFDHLRAKVRHTKKDAEGHYYIDSVNGLLESDKFGHVYGAPYLSS